MITPPLDKIPAIPGQLMQVVVKQVNVQLDKAFGKLDTLLDEVAVLPDNCKCDDPRITDIEEKLNEVLELVNKLKEEILPLIQDIVTAVGTLVKVATAIKAAIFLIPVVGVAALQAELMMVQNATKQFEKLESGYLIIENVGNLVCPALFDLGENKRVVIMSVTEGEDKPIKYPTMFKSANLCIINKIDLLPYLDFDIKKAKDYALQVNRNLEFIELSVRTGEGMEGWYDWIKIQKASE